MRSVVILEPKDAIIQQGKMVLLGGNICTEDGELYSGEKVIEFSVRKEFVAQVKSHLVVFHPNI